MKHTTYFYLALLLIISINATTQTTAVIEGSLGIGENNPAARIEVNAETNEKPLILNINNVRKFTVNGNGGVAIGGPFITLPDNGLFVSGKTGIGTTAPNAKLQINHDGSGSDPQLLIFESQSSDFGRINYRTSGNLERWTISARTSPGNDTTLRFYHSSVGDIMAISAKNRVGIGTTAPNAKLQINHDGSGSNPQLLISESQSSDFGRINYVTSGSAERWTVSARTSIGNDTTLRFYHSTVGDIMTISGKSRVGIGTASPDSKLEVVGSESNGATGGIHIKSGSQDMILDGNEIDADEGLYLNNNVSQDVIVAIGGGDVGIGTASPDSKLEIVGSDSDGLTGALHLQSGSQDMVLDGNEIDADEGLFLNDNLNQNIIMTGGGGSVGIGTNSPAARLSVEASGQDPIRVKANGSTKFRVFDNGGTSIGTSASPDPNGIRLHVGVPGEDLMIRMATCGISNDPCFPRMVPQTPGTWQVGTQQAVLDAVSANNFFGIYGPPSDRRLKENIRPIDHPMDIIQQLNGQRYGFTKAYYYDQTGHRVDEFKRQNQWGLIAQEVEEILPELVINNDETGQKSLDYVSLIPILIEGMKKQQSTIEKQETQISALVEQVQMLSAQFVSRKTRK